MACMLYDDCGNAPDDVAITRFSAGSVDAGRYGFLISSIRVVKRENTVCCYLSLGRAQMELIE
jgi:hypothetical protein